MSGRREEEERRGAVFDFEIFISSGRERERTKGSRKKRVKEVFTRGDWGLLLHLNSLFSFFKPTLLPQEILLALRRCLFVEDKFQVSLFFLISSRFPFFAELTLSGS